MERLCKKYLLASFHLFYKKIDNAALDYTKNIYIRKLLEDYISIHHKPIDIPIKNHEYDY